MIEAIEGDRHRLIFVADRKTRILLGALAVALLLNSGTDLVGKVMDLAAVLTPVLR